MRRAANFSKSAVTRAVGGVLAAGYTKDQISGISVKPDGSIDIRFGTTVDHQSHNEWDEVLRDP